MPYPKDPESLSARDATERVAEEGARHGADTSDLLSGIPFGYIAAMEIREDLAGMDILDD